MRRKSRDMLLARSTSPTWREEPERPAARAPAADVGRDAGRDWGWRAEKGEGGIRGQQEVLCVYDTTGLERAQRRTPRQLAWEPTSTSISMVNLFFLNDVEMMDDQEWR